MMLAIYKYKIKYYETIIDAPIINWLKIDYQKREGCYVAWALVDIDAPDRKFKVIWVETGEHISETSLKGFQYLDSVNQDLYVAHFFVAELNPETLEVMVDDEAEEPVAEAENGDWIDPEIMDMFKKFSMNSIDWVWHPERGVTS